jgi:hypothetical protein
MSKRSSHLIHEANATLSNQYRGWAKAYMFSRDEALINDDVEE